MTALTTTETTSSGIAGKLRIGDQWNAITILAHSQTHPLKAVCELTENAIDAGGVTVEIQRYRKNGETFLQISDDGAGIVLDDQGVPNFRHLATHICDSMKRKLDESQRKNVHGEYGIGLLSFWALGSELRMISPDNHGDFHEMKLSRGKKKYQVTCLGAVEGLRGARVIVGPLLESTRQIVTGEKIQKYLAVELRDRIRNTDAQVQIVDRVARKELVVSPREFDGERLKLPEHVAAAHGDVTLELYLAPIGETGAEVSLCKDGTRVLDHIGELIQFEGPPWNESRLRGLVDYPALRLAPGTRKGVIPDQRLEELVTALESVKEDVTAAIEVRDKAESEEASRRVQLQVHKALKTAIRELPSNDYLFFDLPKADKKGSGPAKKDDASQRPSPLTQPSQTQILPFDPGPLHAVAVTPRTSRRRPGDACMLKARGADDDGFAVLQDVQFAWRIVEGEGRLLTDGDRCQVMSDHRGVVRVEVQATQGSCSVVDQVPVRFLETTATGSSNRRKGLPSYRLVPAPGSSMRSYYDVYQNEIVINSAHQDFVDSNTSAAKHRRYIGKIYAKEVVLLNFPDAAAPTVAERLIELMVRTEESL